MRPSIACLVAASTVLMISASVQAAELTQEQRRQTVAYVMRLQDRAGGFRASGNAERPTLGATSSALRAVKYMGGSVPNESRYLEACRNGSGAFAEFPNDTPTVRSTAMGLMTAVECKNPIMRDASNSIRGYFEQNAKSLPDIYIAAAALDAAGLKSSKVGEWIKAFEQSRNTDGTYGKDVTDTAGAVITIVRLGGKVDRPQPAIHQMVSAQNSDGGFGVGSGPSNLSATYRVMRGLKSLDASPDLSRLRSFIARCRNADGGYGMEPGQPSAISPTYFAAIVLRWADEMEKK